MLPFTALSASEITAELAARVRVALAARLDAGGSRRARGNEPRQLQTL